jgi:predicted ATPase
MSYAFQNCILDLSTFTVHRRGRLIKIEPKVFDVLVYLIEHRERVVSKIELLDTLWPGEAVSDSVLPRCIAAARRVIGDTRSKQRGNGNIALVVGEPGIGKTSLANELMRLAREQKAQVILGRCYEGEGAPAYWPWIQVLRIAVESTPRESLARELGSGASDLAEILPELRTLQGDVPAAVGPLGEQAQFRLFDAAARFLISRSARAPMLIVIDDLHWADAASLGLLRFMARETANHPILLLGTYRDVEVRRGHPLADTLGALAREANCERILLTGLETPEIEDFVAAQDGGALRTELAQTLRDMTDGNPFFLREVVKLLADREDLTSVDPKDLHALALPQGVRARWEELMPLPLDEVRRQLGVPVLAP